MWSPLQYVRGALVRWAEPLLAGVLAAGVICFFSGRFTTVRFDRERIEVQVAPGSIQVKGLYHYANASWLPAALTLRVPFPIDSDHPQPDWFALYESSEDGRAGAEIPPVVRGSNVSFRLIFRPREAKWIRLDYIQPRRVDRGRYLLTTTKPWRRPMERADYILRLPRDCVLISSNYAVSPAPPSGDGQAFTFSRTNFFPNQDWEFAWNDSRAVAATERGHQP